MKIDFIKWKVSLAEGFSIEDKWAGSGRTKEAVKLVVNKAVHRVLLSEIEESLIYPMLQQRAIDGVNKGHGAYVINQDYRSIRAINTKTSMHELVIDNISDGSRDYVLKYVYEQVQKKKEKRKAFNEAIALTSKRSGDSL